MAPSQETKTRILVIDDELFFRAALKDVLSEGGFDVVTAENGVEGVRLYKSELPEVVITDMIMPEKGGVSCGAEISKYAKKIGQDPLVILFSSMFNSEEPHEHHSPELGANVHMPKTMKPVDVLILIEELLERKKNKGAAR